MTYDPTRAFRPGLPPAGPAWTSSPPYSFVGGNNDADSVPVGGLAESALAVLGREGRGLATYNLGGSPFGYEPLRQFVASMLGKQASMACTADDVLITSGSLQALDLVNMLLVERGDVVLVEQATYGGMLAKLQRRGAEVVGVEVDDDGLRVESLVEVLERLAAEGRRPAFLYTIPTVQNPTGTVLPLERRRQLLEVAKAHDLVIFEDDCYAELLWDGSRPPTLASLDEEGRVIFCGSFSKSLAPALRVGYIVAHPAVLAQISAMKADAGTGALEQMVVAEYAAAHFDDHVPQLTATLQGKAAAMMTAVEDSFGSLARFRAPKGGIFLWVELTEPIDTAQLVEPAAAVGVEFNAGAGWAADPVWGASRLRLCFGQPSPEDMRVGVARLADVIRGAAPTAGR
ncbi:MAG: PLP-dependent aminotransferase family protein [Acidimicrobiales bacterium]